MKFANLAAQAAERRLSATKLFASVNKNFMLFNNHFLFSTGSYIT